MILLAILVVGCSTEPTSEALPALETALPADNAVPGWSRSKNARTYDSDTLYDFMNGAADLYFTYGFQSLAVGEYVHGGGGQVRVELYRTATDADAYGLYAYNAFGEPLDVGVEGRWESGLGLAFWQRQTFVQIVPREQVDDASLRAFAQAVSMALPEGGVRPGVVNALPSEGMRPGSARFFREQMALENALWLGPANVLGLGPQVEGALAEYERGGERATLVLVTYPDAGLAQAALETLGQAEVEDLVTGQVSGASLGAVFGEIDETAAALWLEQALSALQ